MPHDYLYHRIQRRTTTAQYRFFYNPPGYADIATSGRGRITDVARGPARAANTSYWLIRQYDAETEVPATDPIPEELLRSHIPDRAPSAPRTASQIYWRDNFPQINDEVLGMRVLEIPDRAPAARRAGNQTYWRENLPQINDEVAGMPVWLIPDKAPGPRFVAPWRFFAIKSGGLDIPAAWGDQTHMARGALRSSNNNYLLTVKFNVPEFEPEELRKIDFTQFARGHVRTSKDQYNILRSPQITDEVAGMPVWNIPEFARGPRRTANSIYFVTNPTVEIVAEVPAVPAPEEVQRFLTDFARSAARTANTAYSIVLTFPPGIADVATSGRGFATLFARGSSRAPNNMYWRDTGLGIPEAAFIDGLRVWDIPEFARTKARATNDTYWRDNKPQINDEVAGMPVWTIPEFARGPQRTANETYWRDNANIPEIPNELVGLRVWDISDFARSQTRTANDAYWHPSPIQVPDLPPLPQGEVFFQRSAIGASRTANDVYWILTKAPVTDVVPAQVIGRGFRSDFAPRSQPKARAANSAYWRMNPRQLDDGCIFVCLDGFQLDTRAARTAYQFRGLPQIEDVEPLELRRMIFPHRIEPIITPNAVYWRDNPQPLADEVPPNDRMNEFFRRLPRSAEETYWRNNQLQIADEPQLASRILNPILGAMRAPNGEYWIALLPQIPGEVQQNTRIFVPLLVAQRAPEAIYWNDNRLSVETVGFPVELMFKQIPMRADGRQRAANTQYEFRMPPFEVPPDLIRESKRYFVHSTHRKRGHRA